VPVLPTPPRIAVATRPAAVSDEPYYALDQRQVDVEAAGKHATGSYTAVVRRAIDASVMVAYYMHSTGARVYLRSCLRPPLAFMARPAVLWELPAGLVEPGEAPIAAAARELHEELGFVIAESELIVLGPPIAPAAGLIAEMQTFYRVEVDPHRRVAPLEDGSPFELGGEVIDVALSDALTACRNGEIMDAKTEIGLRRLAETLSP
jgi:ADP-ribose pyrophosphatase